MQSEDNKTSSGFPRQKIPASKKTLKWCKQCIDWADNHTYSKSKLVRGTYDRIESNISLLHNLNGDLNYSDVMDFVNPYGIKAKYIPKRIKHYPIMNNRLHVLQGEEEHRPFEYKFTITNPSAISEVEEAKIDDAKKNLINLLQNQNLSQEEYAAEVDRLSDYYKYNYQDVREMWCSMILNHYSRQHNFQLMFNKGFFESFASAWEVYDISSSYNEPTVEWVDARSMSCLMSRNSNRIEDAEVVTRTTWMHLSEIIDKYSCNDGQLKGLTEKDIDYLEKYINGNINLEDDQDPDSLHSNYYRPIVEQVLSYKNGEESIRNGDVILSGESLEQSEAILNGMIRVTEVRWKSKRRIRRIKRYNPETGEIEYHIFNDKYVLDENMGEEVEEFWINDPYQGVKIGDNIYIRCGERRCKFRSAENPSKCHLGYVGSLYSFDNVTPYCMVDMMRNLSILYDVIMNKLLGFIARDKGKPLRIDLAKIPRDNNWDINKYMYFLEVNGISFENSFNEGDKGMATGKLAGAMNNNSSGVMDANMSAVIYQYTNILEWIKNSMTELIGVSNQRLGQISNRETVGGVERSTLQSSHITEWVFSIHDDIKRRVCEAFIDQAKVCYAGKNIKMRNILPQAIIDVIDIDGEFFKTADYGCIVDNSNSVTKFNQQLDTIAQAALQNQLLDFSTIMNLYSSCSMAEKMAMVRNSERKVQQQREQQIQQANQIQQQEIEAKQQLEQAKMQQTDAINQRDNETKILIANIDANTKAQLKSMDIDNDGIVSESNNEQLMQRMKEFDEQMKLEQNKLDMAKYKIDEDNKTKLAVAKLKPNNSKTK